MASSGSGTDRGDANGAERGDRIAQWRRVWDTDPEVAIAMAQGKPDLFRADDAPWWNEALTRLAPEALHRVLVRLGDPAQYPWATPAVRLALLGRFRDAGEIVWHELMPWFASIPRDDLVVLGIGFCDRWMAATRTQPAPNTAAAPAAAVKDVSYDLLLAMLRNPAAAMQGRSAAPDEPAAPEAGRSQRSR